MTRHLQDRRSIHLHAVTRWTMAAVAGLCVLFAWRVLDTSSVETIIAEQQGRSELFGGAAALVGVAAGLLLLGHFVLTLEMASPATNMADGFVEEGPRGRPSDPARLSALLVRYGKLDAGLSCRNPYLWLQHRRSILGGEPARRP